MTITNFYSTDEIYDKYDEFLLTPRAQDLINLEASALNRSNLSEHNIKIIKSGIKSEFVGWITNLGDGVYNHTKIPVVTPQGRVQINLEESPDFQERDAFVSWLIGKFGDDLAIPLYSQ